MHNNFSDFEISNLARVLGSDFNVRRNKAGNITVEYLPEFIRCGKWDKKFWTLYFTSDGTYLWRRWTSTSYCFPLHGVNRKRIGEIHYENYNGYKYTWYYREWNIKNCEFDTYEDAISYFVYYLRKYRNIDLKITPINPVEIANEYANENFNKEYINNCTDSDHFDWLDWFDNKYPYRTKNERTKFAMVIEDLYQTKVNEFYGDVIDYNNLNDAVASLKNIQDTIITTIKNKSYHKYNSEFMEISNNIGIIGKKLQNIVHEIYNNL